MGRTMANRKRERALHALKKFTKERNFLVGDEEISPAEVWLLEKLESVSHPNSSSTREYRRKFVSLGLRLGLFPIPEWWKVRQRVLRKSVEPYQIGQNQADPPTAWWSNRP